MHYSYLCCKDCFVKNKQNSMYFPNLLLKCLAICIRAQRDYEGYLQEIYVPIAVDFQEPSRMMCHTCCLKNMSLPCTWNENQVQIRNTYPWYFNNLIWNAVFPVSFCLRLYLIEDVGMNTGFQIQSKYI